MLTTLPGWASYVQYRTSWADARDQVHPHPVTKEDYVALRLLITCLVWKEAKSLLNWHKHSIKSHTDSQHLIKKIKGFESAYRNPLIGNLATAKVC